MVKHFALLMSLCYLLNPLQTQITHILHELSHGLELPSFVMTHGAKTDIDFEAHIPHVHQPVSTAHEHQIIDFVNSIFIESNKKGDSEDSQWIEIKWDKHMTTYCTNLPRDFQHIGIETLLISESFLLEGCFERLERPPQHILG